MSGRAIIPLVSGRSSASRPPRKAPWLHAWHCPLAALRVFTTGIALVDVEGDGERKLVVADLTGTLKVFKDTAMTHTLPLACVPTALSAVYTPSSAPTPLVVVASGTTLFFYRRLHLFHTLTYHRSPVDAREDEIWWELRSQRLDLDAAGEQLTALVDAGVDVASTSLDLLSAEGQEAKQAVVDALRGGPLTRPTVITCMVDIRRNREEDHAPGCLILGTENRDVLILDPSSTGVAKTIHLPSIPALFSVSGLLDVDYTLAVACRDGTVLTIQNHAITGTIGVFAAPLCGLAILRRMVYVACESAVHCHELESSTRAFTLYMPSHVTNLAVLDRTKTSNMVALLVALADGEVRTYNGRVLVDVLRTGDGVMAMLFGQYARMENSLVLVLKSGALVVKMVQRQANFTDAWERKEIVAAPPINIPKRTKFYLEQATRERSHTLEIHQSFQRDLGVMRLQTARTFIDLTTEGRCALSSATHGAPQLHAQTQGLGPQFTVSVTIQTTEESEPISDVLLIVRGCVPGAYIVTPSIVPISLLIPWTPYTFTVAVVCAQSGHEREGLCVLAFSPSSCLPLASVGVPMPTSESSAWYEHEPEDLS